MSAQPMVAGLILRDGKVLLVHNVKHGLSIEPPGGKVEGGEGLEEALQREVREEIGVDVRVLRLIGIYDATTPEGTFNVATYLCAIERGQPHNEEPVKIADLRWYSPQELQDLSHLSPTPLANNVLPALRALPFLTR